MATQFTDELTRMLRDLAYSDRGTIGPILAKLEEGTKIRRDYIVHGVITIFVAYLILGRSAELVCNLIGFVYPAYASIKAIQSPDSSDDTQWLTYWVVYAFFSVAEFASDQIVGWFPFYWLAKFLFLLWLYLPQTRGAELVYTRFIVPFMEKYSAKLAEIEKEIREQLRRQSAEKPVPNGDSVPIPELPIGNKENFGIEEIPVPVDVKTATHEPIVETPTVPLVSDMKPEEPKHPLVPDTKPIVHNEPSPPTFIPDVVHEPAPEMVHISKPETVHEPAPEVVHVSKPETIHEPVSEIVNKPTPIAPQVIDHGTDKDHDNIGILTHSDSGLHEQKQ